MLVLSISCDNRSQPNFVTLVDKRTNEVLGTVNNFDKKNVKVGLDFPKHIRVIRGGINQLRESTTKSV